MRYKYGFGGLTGRLRAIDLDGIPPPVILTNIRGDTMMSERGRQMVLEHKHKKKH